MILVDLALGVMVLAGAVCLGAVGMLLLKELKRKD